MFQPLLPWVESQTEKLPHGFTARSKLQPDITKCLNKLESDLLELQRRTWYKKATQTAFEVHGRFPIMVWDPQRLGSFFDEWVTKHSKAVPTQRIAGLRERLKFFVVTPLDKWMADGMVFCQVKWKEAISRMASTMRTLPRVEEVRIFNQMFRFGQRLQYLPYLGLRKAEKHKFGRLKVWLKRRAFENTYPTEWASLPWRPLAPYSFHHWRGLFSLAGKFCCYVTRFLKWGWGVHKPQDAMETATIFNQNDEPERNRRARYRDLRGFEPDDNDLVTKLYDIKEFFPHVNTSELYLGIEEARADVLLQLPQTKFF